MSNKVKKAAILLLSLGEDIASEVLKNMNPKEVQKVGQAMSELKLVTRGEVQQVMAEFVETVDQYTGLGVDTDDYIRSMLRGALGDEKANNIIDRILIGGSTRGLETLKWMDPRAIADLIRNEHPQIIAIVMSYLESEQAAAVMELFPESMRSDIIMRLAILDGVQPAALQELNDIMEKQFIGQANLKQSNIGGVKTAASVLNYMETTMEVNIIDTIKETDPELGQKIQDLMFVFDNLMEMDDRSVQTLLREVSSESLILALKGAEERLREKFFANMSKRASEMLREDLETKGPVRVSEVEGAQKEILAIARRMAEAGDLVLQSKGGDDFV